MKLSVLSDDRKHDNAAVVRFAGASGPCGDLNMHTSNNWLPCFTQHSTNLNCQCTILPTHSALILTLHGITFDVFMEKVKEMVNRQFKVISWQFVKSDKLVLHNSALAFSLLNQCDWHNVSSSSRRNFDHVLTKAIQNLTRRTPATNWCLHNPWHVTEPTCRRQC